MTIKISQDVDQDNKLNSESKDINKKFLGSVDRKESHDTARISLHNEIHNMFLNFVKTERKMSDAYFKVSLSAVYSDIFKKNLSWKNITDEADVQLNIKRILKDYSYIKIYDILKYYSDEAEQNMLEGSDIVNITAMFYSSLYFFVKREMTE